MCQLSSGWSPIEGNATSMTRAAPSASIFTETTAGSVPAEMFRPSDRSHSCRSRARCTARHRSRIRARVGVEAKVEIVVVHAMPPPVLTHVDGRAIT
jgi:hypothetical protein